MESHTKDPNIDLLILCLLSFYSCLKVVISITVILYSIYKMAGRALDSFFNARRVFLLLDFRNQKTSHNLNMDYRIFIIIELRKVN